MLRRLRSGSWAACSGGLAIASAQRRLAGHPGAREVSAALTRAVALAEESVPAGPEQVESLGEGWVAEEALAIAVFCALRATSFVGRTANVDLQERRRRGGYHR